MKSLRNTFKYLERIFKLEEDEEELMNRFFNFERFTFTQLHRIKALFDQVEIIEAELVKYLTQLKRTSKSNDKDYYKLVEHIKSETMFLLIVHKDLKKLLKQTYKQEKKEMSISHDIYKLEKKVRKIVKWVFKEIKHL